MTSEEQGTILIDATADTRRGVHANLAMITSDANTSPLRSTLPTWPRPYRGVDREAYPSMSFRSM